VQPFLTGHTTPDGLHTDHKVPSGFAQLADGLRIDRLGRDEAYGLVVSRGGVKLVQGVEEDERSG